MSQSPWHGGGVLRIRSQLRTTTHHSSRQNPESHHLLSLLSRRPLGVPGLIASTSSYAMVGVYLCLPASLLSPENMRGSRISWTCRTSRWSYLSDIYYFYTICKILISLSLRHALCIVNLIKIVGRCRRRSASSFAFVGSETSIRQAFSPPHQNEQFVNVRTTDFLAHAL
jgi:hypothetical protein